MSFIFCAEVAAKAQVTQKKEYILQRTRPQASRNIFRKIKDIPKEKLVYIDETGLQTQMYRQYARSKRGKRVNIRISGKRHARIGLVAAQCEGALRAPRSYSGMLKAFVFEKWFEDKLLNCLPKGHVIIMDNAAFYEKRFCRILRENTRRA